MQLDSHTWHRPLAILWYASEQLALKNPMFIWIIWLCHDCHVKLGLTGCPFGARDVANSACWTKGPWCVDSLWPWGNQLQWCTSSVDPQGPMGSHSSPTGICVAWGLGFEAFFPHPVLRPASWKLAEQQWSPTSNSNGHILSLRSGMGLRCLKHLGELDTKSSVFGKVEARQDASTTIKRTLDRTTTDCHHKQHPQTRMSQVKCIKSKSE